MDELPTAGHKVQRAITDTSRPQRAPTRTVGIGASAGGELLARHTLLPIKLVENGMSVEADHVYLIPPRKEMIISGSGSSAFSIGSHRRWRACSTTFWRRAG